MNQHLTQSKLIQFSFAGEVFQTERVIGEIGNENGPTVVLIGGMHGNEPTGVIAIKQMIEELRQANVPLNGRVIGLVGNMGALARDERFITEDLNRMWNQAFLKKLLGQLADDQPSNQESKKLGEQPEFLDQGAWDQASESLNAEERERYELYALLEPMLKDPRHVQHAGADPNLFIVDLHTTSSQSIPFMGINDQIANRKFASKFPVPTVLGIEEYLVGPLLTLLNDEGHVAMAFEAGQHQAAESLELHRSFAYCALVNAGVVTAESVNASKHQRRLEEGSQANRGMFEVVYRKPVARDDLFVMSPGFENFSAIQKGAQLATDQSGTITAHRGGLILMPLYQSTGDDGFFIVRRVPGWALKLSQFLRHYNFESLLLLLPGISRSTTQVDALVVNKKVARFLAVEIFHLLGYRRKQDQGGVMIFSRREIESVH